ncbi:MAG TPA: hypothetical protein VF386_09130 [Usitatibacter sp.]
MDIQRSPVWQTYRRHEAERGDRVLRSDLPCYRRCLVAAEIETRWKAALARVLTMSKYDFNLT